MRLLLEIKEHPIQSVINGRNQIRLKGTDRNGRMSAAVAYGFTADNILKSLSKLVDQDTDFSDRSVTIDLNGDWKDGKEYFKEGRKVKYRYFQIEQFQFLLGPALELQKIRQDSLAAFHRSEAFRAEGDFRSAYRELLVQAGRTCNMIDEVSEIVESLDKYAELPDDLDVIPMEETGATPEAVALQKLAPAMVFEEAAISDEVNDAVSSVAGNETNDDTNDDDFVFGEVEVPTENTSEDSDVLDDEPVADISNVEVKEESEVKPAAPRPLGVRPISGFGRPLGFGRG